MLKIMEGSHGSYETDLVRYVELTDDEEGQMLLLARSFYRDIRCRFVGSSHLNHYNS